MNPQSNEQSGLNLPPPVVEQAPIGPMPETQIAAGEAAIVAPEHPKEISSAGAGLPTIPLPIVPTTNQAGQNPVVIQTTQSSTSAGVDDSDLIEKEWVAKAKKIVESTRDDPHEQSKQITEVRVDYLKKRYNKTVKLAE